MLVFLGGGKTGVPREKPHRARERTNNKLKPHNDVDARIRTWAALVGGECSHHCATLAPLEIIIMGTGDCLKHLRCE